MLLELSTTNISFAAFFLANAVAMIYLSEKMVEQYFNFQNKKQNQSSSTSKDPSETGGLSAQDSNTKERNFSRSSAFLWRSIIHHIWSKGRFVIHGLGGMSLLLSSTLCIMRYHVTGTRGSLLDQWFLGSLTFFSLGLLTPYMMRKQHKMGFRQYTLQKHMILVVALGAMPFSHYVASPPVDESTFDHRVIFTWIAFALFPISLCLQSYEIVNKYVWSTKGVFVSFTSPIPLIYGPCVYRYCFGNEALEQIMRNTNLADALYLLCLGSLVCVAIDQFFLTMATRKVISMEQRIRSLTLMWAVFGVYCAAMVCILVSPTAAFGYLMFVGLQFPLNKMVPERYLDNFEENMKGMYFAENAGKKLALFQ